ncbi:hypothetical protein BU23DRAFT_632021, partial [Bimuria novae-zelandiae CBS 107.79]
TRESINEISTPSHISVALTKLVPFSHPSHPSHHHRTLLNSGMSFYNKPAMPFSTVSETSEQNDMASNALDYGQAATSPAASFDVLQNFGFAYEQNPISPSAVSQSESYTGAIDPALEAWNHYTSAGHMGPNAEANQPDGGMATGETAFDFLDLDSQPFSQHLNDGATGSFPALDPWDYSDGNVAMNPSFNDSYQNKGSPAGNLTSFSESSSIPVDTNNLSDEEIASLMVSLAQEIQKDVGYQPATVLNQEQQDGTESLFEQSEDTFVPRYGTELDQVHAAYATTVGSNMDFLGLSADGREAGPSGSGYTDPYAALTPPVATAPVHMNVGEPQKTLTNPAGSTARRYKIVDYNKEHPPSDLIRDAVKPQPDDYSASALIYRFVDKTKHLVQVDFTFSDHWDILYESLQEQLLNELNRKLVDSLPGLYSKPLLRECFEDDFEQDILPFIVFAKSGLQRWINWRFCVEHLEILQNLDMGKPDLELEDFDQLVKATGVWKYRSR